MRESNAITNLSDQALPSPPRAALRLIDLFGNPDSDISEIVQTISLDAVLAARLLRVANSPHYGQQYTVATLERAVVVLGFDYVKVVALGFHLLDLSKSWEDVPIDLGALWQGHILRACLARQLVSHSRMIPNDCRQEAFLVGLLQDLTVPLIARSVGDDYAGWLTCGGQCSTGAMLDLEKRATGENHASLVGRLCETWNLPEQFAFALSRHHTQPPHAPPEDRAAGLWLVAYFVGTTPFGEDRRTASVSDHLRGLAETALGLDEAALGNAFYAAVDDYDALRPVFQGMLPRDVNGTDVLREAWRLVAGLANGEIPESTA